MILHSDTFSLTRKEVSGSLSLELVQPQKNHKDEMEELAGEKGEVVLFASFEELTQSIVNEFTSKSCGKLRLLRKEQPLHHNTHIVCHIWLRVELFNQ